MSHFSPPPESARTFVSAGNLFNRRMTKTLERLRACLGLKELEFADLMDLDKSGYDQVRLGHQVLSLENLIALCDNLQLNLEQLLSDQLDLDQIASQYYLHAPKLPERYQNQSLWLSRARAVRAITQYISNVRGPNYALLKLRSLNLTLEHFKNPEQWVHPSIGADLLQALAQSDFCSSDIKKIGKWNAAEIQNTLEGSALSKSRSTQELYETLHFSSECKNLFDSFFTYELKASSSEGCTVTLKPSEYAMDVSHGKLTGNIQMCQYKQGVYSAFAALGLANSNKLENQSVLGTPGSLVTESSCYYKGDSHCTYHIEHLPKSLPKQLFFQFA